MKKILVLGLAALAVVSCKKETPVDYALVSGKISNLKGDKITVVSSYDYSDAKEIKVDENGAFKDTIKLKNASYYAVYDDARNSFQIYLDKGVDLNFDYNAQKLDSTLTFSGNDTSISNYLKDSKKAGKDLVSKTQEFYAKNEQDFLAAVKKLKAAKDDALFNANGLSEEFKKNESNNLKYEYLSFIANYENYHGYFTKNREFKASENFADEVKNIALDNESDFAFSSFYRNLVASNYQTKASEMVEKDSTLSRDLAYLKVVSGNKVQAIKNKLLYDDATFGITYTENLEEYYKLFSENSTNEDNNKKIKESYDKLMRLAAGNASPKFTNYENNAGGTTSLDDLKGKFVYIDVWATWCGPCIAEIPSLKKVEEQYHDKNIEFVSISIDDEKDHDKWKKMIVDRELKGVQLMADANWKSQFVEDYMIKGIPRFILIDPQGNIVTANAPRPSSPKLIEMFNANKI